jgi:hypothetical protein
VLLRRPAVVDSSVAVALAAWIPRSLSLHLARVDRGLNAWLKRREDMAIVRVVVVADAAESLDVHGMWVP